MAPAEVQAAEESFLRGYHSLPDDKKIQAMSFIQLSELYQSCEKDSTKFHVVEREVKKRLAKDQAKINRKNIIIGSCIGGLFTIVGVILGWWLKSCPLCESVASSSTVHKIGNVNLAVKPPVAKLPLSVPPIPKPTDSPSPVRNDAQPSKHNP